MSKRWIAKKIYPTYGRDGEIVVKAHNNLFSELDTYLHRGFKVSKQKMTAESPTVIVKFFTIDQWENGQVVCGYKFDEIQPMHDRDLVHLTVEAINKRMSNGKN